MGLPEAQKLIGAMVGDGVKRGMIITSAGFTKEAKEYISRINERGYRIEMIDGDSLMSQLYDLREVKLKEMIALG